MQTPKNPVLYFPRKPQIRKKAKIGVISGLLIRAYRVLICRLLMPLITPFLNRPRLIQVFSTMGRKERHLVGLPVRFSISANFSVFDTEN